MKNVSVILGAVLLCLLSACGGGGDRDAAEGDAEPIETSRVAKDGIFQPCGGGPRSSLNPFGLARGMNESEEANRNVLGDVWERGVAIERSTSRPIRVVLHQPGGWFTAADDGMRGALPTVDVMNGRKRNGSLLYPWRWSVWQDELLATTAAHPDWVFGVYFSGQVPTAAAEDAVDATQTWEVYDHENLRHRVLMLELVDQWMAVGVEEFLLDGTAQPTFGEDVPKLAAEIRAKGGRLFVEGHPRGDQNQLRTDFLQQVDGSLSLHKFMVDNEPESLDWTVPAGSTMLIALTTHTTSDDPSRTTATQSDVDGYRSRGFAILSSRAEFDRFVTE